MSILSISPDELEALIKKQLDIFYDRRIKKLSHLDLWDTLRRKNPYLFRAIGMQDGSEIVKELLQAYMSSSDEGLFGHIFFEPIAQAVGGGVAATDVGMDVVIDTPQAYTVVQVKSGPNWGNADQKRKLKDNFENAQAMFLSKNINKQFRALLGQCYGRATSEPSDKRLYAVRSGQSFWEEITGDPEFYLKLIRLMKDYPSRHRPDYQDAWSNAVNRFTKEFLEHFSTSEGSLDWEKIVQLNSGKIPPRKPRKKK
ncbi:MULTISPECIES: PmeII family type II restriction endonuclease [unclassified Microcoleus]|uniref:PmeII family type II restriction endonuclease n=1 Tax=unclassified Microcoleus TaxID=2642155 RepID=UPI002FD535DB